MRLDQLLFCLLALGVGFGCDDDDSASDGGALSQDAQPDVAPQDALPEDGAPPSDAGAPDAACEGITVERFEGQVQDDGEQPAAGARAQVCAHLPGGRLVCLNPVAVDDQGHFSVTVPAQYRCLESAVMRLVHFSADLAPSYCEVELTSPVVQPAAPYVLFRTARPSALPAEGDRATVREVAFPEGLTIEVAPDRLFGGGDAYFELAAIAVEPTDQRRCRAVDENLMFDALFAFSPETDVEGEPIVFHAPTDAADGTRFATYILGGLECLLEGGETLPEGTWYPVGEATAQGGIVVGSGGAALPCLTWLGLIRLP